MFDMIRYGFLDLKVYLTAWTKAAGIGRDKKGPLFGSVGKGQNGRELHGTCRLSHAAAVILLAILRGRRP